MATNGIVGPPAARVRAPGTARAVTVLAITVLLALAAYHLLLTASTVTAFGLRYPFMDQWRTTLLYLTTPFPANVLALENGHRPVLPGLVRLMEIASLHGMPRLQTATAWLAAAAVWLALVRVVVRGLRGHPVDAAAGVCAISCLVFWIMNARMFIHPFEAVHVFYVLALLVLALWCVTRPTSPGPGAWLLALAACAAATFSFGSGFACFAGVAAVALIRRERPGILLLIVAGALVMFAVYYVVLPGAEGVRGSIGDGDLASRALWWIARVGAVAVELVRPYGAAAEVHTWVAVGMGAAVLAIAAVALVRLGAARRQPLALVASGLLAFGLAANALVVMSRTAFFRAHPAELFADRYLIWSTLCWAAAALLALARRPAAARATRWPVVIVVGLVAALGIAPALEVNGWSAEVHRRSELNAAALRAGLVSEDDRGALVGEPVATMQASIAALRAHRLAMFRGPATVGMGSTLALQAAGPSVPVRLEPAPPPYAGPSFTQFTGRLPHDATMQARDATLWVMDATGRVIGAAALTYVPRRRVNALRIGIALMSGVQGYVTAGTAPAMLVAVGADAVPHVIARLAPLTP